MISEFIKVIQDLDVNKTGKIEIHGFIKALKEKNLIFNRNKEDTVNLTIIPPSKIGK